MMDCRAGFLVLVLLLAAAPAAGQGDASPSGVLRAAYDALERREWLAAARLVDTPALRDFRDMHLRMVEADTVDRWEPVRRHDPEMPECVIDYWRRQEEKFRGDGRAAEMFGTSDVEALKRLPPDELLARWLQATDPRETMQRVVTRQMPKLAQKAAAADTARAEGLDRRTVIGEVADGDSLVYVAYRRHFHPDDAFRMVRMATLRRGPRGWRIASADFLGGDGASFMAFGPVVAEKPREKGSGARP